MNNSEEKKIEKPEIENPDSEGYKIYMAKNELMGY